MTLLLPHRLTSHHLHHFLAQELWWSARSATSCRGCRHVPHGLVPASQPWRIACTTLNVIGSSLPAPEGQDSLTPFWRSLPLRRLLVGQDESPLPGMTAPPETRHRTLLVFDLQPLHAYGPKVESNHPLDPARGPRATKRHSAMVVPTFSRRSVIQLTTPPPRSTGVCAYCLTPRHLSPAPLKGEDFVVQVRHGPRLETSCPRACGDTGDWPVKPLA